MTSRRINSIRIIAAALGFVLVPVLIGAAFLTLSAKPHEQLPFDAVGWHGPRYNADTQFTGTRLRMVDDLLRQYDFHGWTVGELEALLGEADFYELDGQRLLVKYDLSDGLNWLLFEIGPQQLVLEYQALRDD